MFHVTDLPSTSSVAKLGLRTGRSVGAVVRQAHQIRDKKLLPVRKLIVAVRQQELDPVVIRKIGSQTLGWVHAK